MSEKLLFDDNGWNFIEPPYNTDPNAADALADNLATIRTAMLSGPEGVERADATLMAGIEAAFRCSRTYKAAFRLYVLNFGGELPPDDEPLTLIRGALKRAGVRIEDERGDE
jgi:hypothetical protein